MTGAPRPDYHRIADEMDFPTQCFIDGEFRPAVSGKTFSSINPATGQALADVSAGAQADVDDAVRCARDSFERGSWSRLHPSERKARLVGLAKLINDNATELAVLESLESGKPIIDCLSLDIPESASTIAWHGEAQDKLYDQIAPTERNALGLIVREPLGVAAAVLPWNFPLLMMAWKIGPALATGNSVIIKPSELTSMSALRLARLALDAGIPNGVLNVVPGTGEEAGQAIGLHPDINIVSFTGSTETGRKFLEYSARSNMKRVVLECGGKNPCVVLDDVADLDKVAERQAFSILTNMGENCASNSRLIVHRSVKEALVEKLVRQFESWKIGDPLDPETQLGAMIGKEHFDKVTGYIEKGRAEGATVRSGGHAIESDGYFIPPTLLDDVRSDMAVFRDEIFGPVLSVVSVASDEEAVAVANDTRYGLTASLYTGSVRKAHTIARRLNAGTVSVNCFSEGDLSTPFGGFKMSGFGGRDNGIHAHDQYTELKTIWLDLSD